MTSPLPFPKSATRLAGGVVIVDLSGSITNPKGAGVLRNAIRELAAAGHRKVLLNLENLIYIDSAGLGELVGACTTVRNLGGEMKLFNPQQRITNLLEMTKVSTLFTIFPDENTALQSFSESSAHV